MTFRTTVRPGAQLRRTPPDPTSQATPPIRDAAARIAELLPPPAAPTRSREEQAFLDLQRGNYP